MKPEPRLRGPVIAGLLCLAGSSWAAEAPQANPPPTTEASLPAADTDAQAALTAALKQAALAEKYRAAKDYRRAIEMFQQSIAIQPTVRGLNGLGITYYRMGRHEDAVRSFKEALALRPNESAVHYNLGLAYQDLGRHEEAASTFREALRLKPDNHAASDGLAVSLGKLKQYPDAVAAALAAIRLAPDDASYRAHLCDLRFATAEYQQAG